MYEELRDKLTAICEKFEALTGRMGEPDLLADREAYRKAAKERSELEETVRTIRMYEKIQEELAGSRELLQDASDAEMRDLAREEIVRLESEIPEIETRLKAGIPLRDAVEGLGRDGRGRLVALADALRSEIEAGATLAEAFASLEAPVPAGHVALIDAGERSGRRQNASWAGPGGRGGRGKSGNGPRS